MTSTETETGTDTLTTVQVYRVYIRATPERVWEAITSSEWTERYGYGGTVEYDLRPGGEFRSKASAALKQFGAPDVIVDGEVLEADPPRKLVQTWRLLMDPEVVAEGFTRLTYEIEPSPGGLTRLTVSHDLTNAPKLALLTGGLTEGEGGAGGWPWILSGLKTLLETGEAMVVGDA
ncbi:MAG TPA: SRPBCC family protein [Acidimicrobiales bacterium]|jgi:uncharacterized protein YndB with AHSA1/START domain|nr:SRPBCC family protein [Acidimicrobiales bacterium]